MSTLEHAKQQFTQNQEVKDLAKNTPFTLNPFNANFDGFSVNLVDSNEALVIALDQSQSTDAELVNSAVQKEVLLFKISNDDTHDHAILVVPVNGGETTLLTAFGEHQVSASAELIAVAEQLKVQVVNNTAQFI